MTQDSPLLQIVTLDVMARELLGLRAILLRHEAILSEHTQELSGEALRNAQEFDLAMQIIEDLAQLTLNLSRSVPDHSGFDPDEIMDGLRLQRVRDKLVPPVAEPEVELSTIEMF